MRMVIISPVHQEHRGTRVGRNACLLASQISQPHGGDSHWLLNWLNQLSGVELSFAGLKSD